MFKYSSKFFTTSTLNSGFAVLTPGACTTCCGASAGCSSCTSCCI